MRDRILKRAKHEYTPGQRLAALAAAAPFFLILLPLLIYRLGGWLDRALGWPALLYPPVNALLGGLMALAGLALAVWTIYVQFTLGRGTPIPVMATQKLIVRPPFWDNDEFEWRPEIERELYDVSHDAAELSDRLAAESERAAALEEAAAALRRLEETGPLDLSESQLQKLRELGYAR